MIKIHADKILKKLHDHADDKILQVYTRFGVQAHNALGIAIPTLRALAKEAGKNQAASLELWKSGIHEARILAGMVGEKDFVTEAQMDMWVKDFGSWDVCDQTCKNLFRHTSFAVAKCHEWSQSSNEWVKRAGFALMAELAIGKNLVTDTEFIGFLPVIMREAYDERNFVKKAVNWALRQIGKRNRTLHAHALKKAEEIEMLEFKSARWIAKDALRELRSNSVKRRVLEKK